MNTEEMFERLERIIKIGNYHQRLEMYIKLKEEVLDDTI